MPRFRILIALVGAICAIAVTASTASASPEMAMIHKVNHYRHQHGLRSVRVSGTLMRSAKSYAHWMMRHQYFGHRSRIHSSSHYRRLGEVLECRRGQGAKERLALTPRKHSTPHRAIKPAR